MRKVLSKIYNFAKQDGFSNTLRYIMNEMQSIFFLRTSHTFFFQTTISNKYDINKTISINFIIVENKYNYLKYKYERLTYYPYEKWFDANSICCIGIINSKAISCIWAHTKSYEIEGIGRYHLSNDEAWIGPSFVDNELRKNGINTLQRKYLINFLIDRNICKLITSVNLHNFPAISNAFRQGYEVFGIYRRKTLFNKTIQRAHWGNFLGQRIE